MKPVLTMYRPDVEIFHGDCMEVMDDYLPTDSIDAIITDPPYHLTSGDRRKDSLSDVLTDIYFPNLKKRNIELIQGCDLFPVTMENLSLALGLGAGRIGPGIAMPEGSIDLEGSTIVQHEVDDAEVLASSYIDLSGIGDSEFVEFPRYFFLKPRSHNSLLVVRSSELGVVIGFGDNPGNQTGLSGEVIAGRRAKLVAVLWLSKATLLPTKLSFAVAAGDGLPLSLTSELVGALPRAGGSPPPFESSDVRLIGLPTDGTVSVDFLSHKAILKNKGFKSSEWDGGDIAFRKETWEECLRVLKPGGHLLSFSGSRTYHRMAVAVEDAGFEIRDMILWMYSAGASKSVNTIKPAMEPIVMARKPLEGTITENIEKWGVGGLNIEGCRIPLSGKEGKMPPRRPSLFGKSREAGLTRNLNPSGRYPSNIVVDEEAEAEIRAQAGEGFVRFCLCGKASQSEREAGLGDLEGANMRIFQSGKADKIEEIYGDKKYKISPDAPPEVVKQIKSLLGR